jgi:hypothetical protein
MVSFGPLLWYIIQLLQNMTHLILGSTNNQPNIQLIILVLKKYYSHPRLGVTKAKF